MNCKCKYNEEHGIIPKTVTKKVAEILEISTHKEEGKEKKKKKLYRGRTQADD